MSNKLKRIQHKKKNINLPHKKFKIKNLFLHMSEGCKQKYLFSLITKDTAANTSNKNSLRKISQWRNNDDDNVDHRFEINLKNLKSQEEDIDKLKNHKTSKNH